MNRLKTKHLMIHFMNHLLFCLWLCLCLCLGLSCISQGLQAQQVASDQDKEAKLASVGVLDRIRLLDQYSREIMESDPAKSFQYTRRAYQLAMESGEPLNIVSALKTIGNWHLINKNYQNAIKHYLEALTYEPHVKDKSVIANLMTNVGIVYWEMENLEMALDYHTRVLELRRRWGYSKYEMAITLNNLGLVAHGLKQYKKALEYFNAALPLYKDAGFKRGVAAALNNIGDVYLETGDYARALDFFNQSIPIYKEIGLQWGIANAHQNVGNVYYRLNQYPKALKSINIALETAGKIEAKDIIHKSYEKQSSVFEAQGDLKKALEFYKRATDLKKTLINEQTSRQIARLDVMYGAEKKDAQIRLLQKKRQFQSLLITFLVVVLILILIMVAIVHSRYRAKRKSSQLLQMSEARYRTLFSQAGDAIFLMERDVFVDCNEKALTMFGMTPQELLGSSFDRISPPTQPDGRPSREIGMPLLEKVSSGEPQHFYWTHADKEGTPFETVVSLSAVTIDDRPLIQAIVHDISDRLKLEDERIKSAKLESIGLLAGGIAHDFNNLLSILAASMEVIQMRTERNEDVSDIFPGVERVLNSATELSEKFLTFSEGGYPSMEVLNISNSIEKIATSLLGQDPRIRLHIDGGHRLKPIQCDIKQLTRALEAILINARDFIRESGEVFVEASNITLNDDEVPPLNAGRYILISIRDNGAGIPPENLPRVFDPYFSTREEYNRKGLGMGLAIALSIIKRHNGTITAQSQPGEGSTFNIYLPASR